MRFRIRFFNVIASVRASYWFIPSLMMLGAFALSSFSIFLDERIAFADLNLPFIYLAQPDGAKTLLATVAGSMLSVASLTFSIVMVVLTMASSQFGPRLLGNFMRDRGNQFVLGTFISTFLYCLLILRVVRGGGDVIDSIFVPQLSVTVALVLAVFNLGAFIYFIHHTAEGIQAANVIGRVNHSLNRKLLKDYPDKPFLPQDVGQGGQANEMLSLDAPGALLRSQGSGYLRAVDIDALMTDASKHDVSIKLLHTPGTYIMRDMPLADVHPDKKLQQFEEALLSRFVLGEQRTQEQDIEFLFDQLLEVALRALSPGVNDPVTAMMCIDRIADNLNLLQGRQLPSANRYDDAGVLRLVIPVLNISALVERLFGPIRNYAKADYMVLHHLLNALKHLQTESNDPVLRQQLTTEITRLLNEAKTGLLDVDYQRLVQFAAQ